MQRIQFAVVRDARFRPVDGFHIYGDSGTGSIDWQHPLTSRRLLFWEDALPMPPHLDGGHLTGHHLDSIVREGHLSGTHLMDQQSQPAGTTVFEVGPFVFGLFKHAVVPVDEVGNLRAAEAVVYETAVNSDPPPASDFKAIGVDEVTGGLRFSFRPSEKLVG